MSGISPNFMGIPPNLGIPPTNIKRRKKKLGKK